MGRSPCCAKEGLNKGAWTTLEDKILTSYIKVHGEGQWRNLPKRAGLKRCGKSCRLRWLNYLRPDIKRGNISHDEEELIIRLHKLLGNRWSLIAGRLPGRTDNEIKNYWNTTLGKKAKAQLSPSPSQESFQTKSRWKKKACEPKSADEPSNSPLTATTKIQVIRTKASKCSKALVPLPRHPSQTTDQIDTTKSTTVDTLQQLQDHQSDLTNNPTNPKDIDHGDEAFQEMHDTNDSAGVLNFGCNDEAKVEAPRSNNYVPVEAEQCLPFVEPTIESWTTNCLEDNAMMNLESLAFLLDSDEWP